MNRIELMELVRERQVGTVSRRDFLIRAAAVLGSAADDAWMRTLAWFDEYLSPDDEI